MEPESRRGTPGFETALETEYTGDMTDWLIFFAPGLAAGLLAGWFWGRACLAVRLAESNTRLEAERQAWEATRRLMATQSEAAARAEAEASERKFELLKAEFRNLAEKILSEKSGDLRNANKEQLDAILTPLKERIGEFRKSVESTHAKSLEINAALREQLRLMMDSARRLGGEADNLARALKGDTKLQGNWGEMILDEILAGSGLIEGRHYVKQAVLTDDDDRALHNDGDARIMRPDVTVTYPDGKVVIIDSKVSLSAYVDYRNAEDDAARADALARHIKSVRAHVDELVRKNYSAHVRKAQREAVDFVVMFIPNEAPHQLAMLHDPNLWREAFDRKVLIVSPVNLMALLQLIHLSWKRFDQERNQQLIVDCAAQLLDRLYGFYTEFDEVGRKLDSARDAYNLSVGRLRGTDGKRSVVQKAEQLKQLGVKMKRAGHLPARFRSQEALETSGELMEEDGEGEDGHDE